MITLFGVTSIMSLILAAGAVEADNYLIGFGFAVFGIVTGMITILSQEKEKQVQLYYKED